MLQRWFGLAVAAVAVVVVALATPLHAATTTEKVRFCGRSLSQAVSMVCRSFNSPAWDEGGAGVRGRGRVKRAYGIVEECCAEGCSWDQLRLYCADDEPLFPSPELAGAASDELGHVIADRSAEAAAEEPPGAGFRGLFGRSEMRLRSASRGAAVVGTVSPLLAWGRTLHADMLPEQRERLLYVTV